MTASTAAPTACMNPSTPNAAIIPTWTIPRWRRGFSGCAGPRTLAEGLAAYLKHLGIPWAEEGKAVSGPGEAKAR
jgi:hypothetical protein